MPKGTRVHRCVDKVKAKGSGVNPYAVCQASTKQSFATGKSTRKSDKKPIDSPKGKGKKAKSESLSDRLDALLLADSVVAQQYLPVSDFADRLTATLDEVFDAAKAQ